MSLKKLVVMGLVGQKAHTEEAARHITARSGMLDADSLLQQAEMFMAPDAFKRFRHFYREQVDSNDRYGCHCQMEMGCANDGISEHYLNYGLSRIGTCYDKPGTCKRAYCECAQQFIEDLNSNAIFRYTPERFSKRRAGFEVNEYTCARRNDLEELGFGRRTEDPGKKSEKRRVGCCSKSKNGDAPWCLYNKDKFRCCEDGSVSVSC